MTTRTVLAQKVGRQQGSSLAIVGVAMLALLVMMGLGIDLVALYLGKSEAQRAADAAALAGALEFVVSGFTSGLVTQATVKTLATNQAIAAGQKNLIGGMAPSIPSGNVTFDFTHAGDPFISVQVGATLPTYFMRVFGVNNASVAATATAEAYNPTGSAAGGPTLCTSCLRPFLVPNCDPVHLVAQAGGNTVCPPSGTKGQNQDYLLVPPNYTVNHPGAAPSGIVGESWSLHTGGPSTGTPSQWYSVAFLGAQSKSAYQANIASCNTDAIVCGTTLQTLDGKSVGPTDKGIESLIHASGQGLNKGQDTIDVTGGTTPFPMYAGSNNPLVAAGIISAGTQLAQSDSLVTTPVYDGSVLTPGGSTVAVVGYLQMFITDVKHNGTDDIINAIIVNVMSCGAAKGGSCAAGGNAGAGGGGSGTSGTVTAGGAGFVPIRLVHP
jgi:hypothetical protein